VRFPLIQASWLLLESWDLKGWDLKGRNFKSRKLVGLLLLLLWLWCNSCGALLEAGLPRSHSFLILRGDLSNGRLIVGFECKLNAFYRWEFWFLWERCLFLDEFIEAGGVDAACRWRREGGSQEGEFRGKLASLGLKNMD
jgi:hypothetical protein